MQASLVIHASVLTDVGRRREVNEDWCGVLDLERESGGTTRGWLGVIADGVGAYGTGEEASRTAGEAILASYRVLDEPDPARRLRLAMDTGNRAVWERRRVYSRQGQSRPVLTTALASLIVGDNAILAHVGDCRAYLLRGGRLQQLTQDHTWVADQVAAGLMTPDAARDHPRGHVISRALGQFETAQVELLEVPLAAKDRLILCSDGLTRHLRDDEILSAGLRGSVEQAARAMLDLANARGGEDNISIAVIEAAPTPELVASPPPQAPSEAAKSPPAPFVQSDTPEAVAPAPAEAVGAPPHATPPGGSRDYLTTVYATARRISASLDLRETLDAVMDSVVEVTGGERGFLMLWDEAAGELVYATGRNVQGHGRHAPEFSRGVVRSVYTSGQAILSMDALADPSVNQYESLVLQRSRALMCVPLAVHGRNIGVIYVDNRLEAGVFSDSDLRLLSAVADQAAVALDNARLHEQLRSQMVENAVMRTNQENVLRSITSAIVALDAGGRIVVFNRPAEELLDLAADAARGRTLAELMPPSICEHLLAVTPRPGEEPGAATELDLDLPGRGRTALAIRVLTLVDAGAQPVGSILILDDLTRQKQLEEARQREAAEKEQIRSAFGRYLAPAVVEQLVANPGAVQLGGVRREVTVLFADIRGFTTFAERQTPEGVVALLNSFLACATEVIRAEGGTVDKFLGDGVMALFNAPLDQPNHALAAVRAAAAMQARMRELARESGRRVAFGVGINTGAGVVGNIGTTELMNYTVIGDVVNVAARLQSEARAGEVLLSADAFQQVSEQVEVEELGAMHVKGRTDPVRCYKILQVRAPSAPEGTVLE